MGINFQYTSWDSLNMWWCMSVDSRPVDSFVSFENIKYINAFLIFFIYHNLGFYSSWELGVNDKC